MSNVYQMALVVDSRATVIMKMTFGSEIISGQKSEHPAAALYSSKNLSSQEKRNKVEKPNVIELNRPLREHDATLRVAKGLGF